MVSRTLDDPPGETTHWTAAAMAKETGISVSSVQRIWRKTWLATSSVASSFKLSNDPRFAAKLRDIIGLYVDPPTHAVVLSIDEKSQIQALDRTQPGLPMKRGRCGTMTHDYIQAMARQRCSLHSTRWMARSSDAACSAIGIRSSFVS